VRDADAGRAAVRDLKSRGADFVKVYSLLPRDAYFAIAEESKEVGIPFEGHVPDVVTNAEASDAGQRSLEHLLGMIREIADPAALAEKRKAIDPSLARFGKRNAVIDAMLATQSPEREKALFAKLVANKTWICPTLIVWNRHIWFDPKDPEGARRLPYVPAYIREWWDPEKNVHLKDLDDEFRAGERRMYARGEELVRGMQKVGIPMMTGSDMGGNPLCFAGWGIHDELRLLVKAGLTPAEALIAATKNPAEFMGAGDRLGTIERGKLADLVLLRADPLADITNIGTIEAVVLNGELLDRARLDALLAKTRERCEKRM
jgi:imidazolonepropionase-like amidohydrolase